MPQRVLNAQPTPDEHIAKEAQAPLTAAAVFPRRVVLTGVPPTQDQGETGTCVAHGAYGVYAWWYKRKYGRFPAITEKSILKFYDLCKANDHDPDPTRMHGTSPLSALQVMASKGYPLDNGTMGPTISGYHFVGRTAEQGRIALAQFRSPILFGVGWDANWFYLPRTHILKAPIGQIVGGHCMYEFGYDLDVNQGCGIDRNSWDGWSSDGYGSCYFAERYKDDPRYWYECWQVTGIN